MLPPPPPPPPGAPRHDGRLPAGFQLPPPLPAVDRLRIPYSGPSARAPPSAPSSDSAAPRPRPPHEQPRGFPQEVQVPSPPPPPPPLGPPQQPLPPVRVPPPPLPFLQPQWQRNTYRLRERLHPLQQHRRRLLLRAAPSRQQGWRRALQQGALPQELQRQLRRASIPDSCRVQSCLCHCRPPLGRLPQPSPLWPLLRQPPRRPQPRRPRRLQPPAKPRLSLRPPPAHRQLRSPHLAHEAPQAHAAQGMELGLCPARRAQSQEAPPQSQEVPPQSQEAPP